jgi:hypothetical protein
MFIFTLGKLWCWPEQFDSLNWQLLDPTLAPHMSWAKDCQPSSQSVFSLATSCFEHILKKLYGNHSCLLWKHNSGSRRHCPRHDCFKQPVLDFLPSQSFVNSRWPNSHFHPGQRGSTSPSVPAEDLWLVQTQSFICMLEHDWCKQPHRTTFLAI